MLRWGSGSLASVGIALLLVGILATLGPGGRARADEPVAEASTAPPTPTPSVRPTFVPLVVEIVVPEADHPIVTGDPLNVRLRITSQYAFDKDAFNVHATLRETILAVERIRDFETGPDTLGVKLGIPNSADLYPGEATLRVCVNTQSSIFGVGAFGCGTLQVQIIR